MLQPIICFLFLLISVTSIAQDKTTIKLNFNEVEKHTLKVEILPLKINATTVEFVIPKLTPGNYWPTNYIRFYSGFKAYDKNNIRLRTKRKKNKIIIYGANKLDRLCYSVKQNMGDKKIWDNVFGCGGTVFRKNAFLLNFDLVAGYFKGYDKLPIEIEVIKPQDLYASTAQQLIRQTPVQDNFMVKNYFDLVDKPTMYCKPDTTSFLVGNSKFYISVYAEQGNIKATRLKPTLKKIITSVNDFFGFLPVSEYHFLIYAVKPDSLKGYINRLGLYSALEHMNCSVYYGEDLADTNIVKSIFTDDAMHEFLHLWAPLTIHTDKIEDYNFETPDMSENIWFYEGFTDYLTAYIIGKYKLRDSFFENSLLAAISSAKKQKAISFTQNCLSLQSHSVFTALKKYHRLDNCYERGKLVAFCLDLELMKLSNNSFRLKNLMAKLYDTYAFKQKCKDNEFADVLISLTYPQIKPFIDKYVKGDELPPYQDYLALLGWRYIENNEKISSYGAYNFGYRPASKNIFMKDVKHSAIKIQNNDTLLEVNGKPPGNDWSDFFFPQKNDSIQIKVNRNGNVLYLKGLANDYRKIQGNGLLRTYNWQTRQVFFADFFGISPKD